ncbi:hypothetical protein RR42_m4186 [Cupriavidus basilensis]|uniref:Uncharacterized protein n=1 Tax=Cupriavidus basilensis TaxID=68895 RepID=A0A0C4YF83_9BURK|nr:hypothetical protein RR42_m4186 [Cupriavidus basilensis]
MRTPTLPRTHQRYSFSICRPTPHRVPHAAGTIPRDAKVSRRTDKRDNTAWPGIAHKHCCGAKNSGERRWYPCRFRCRPRLSVEPCSRHPGHAGQSLPGPATGEAPL